MKERYASKLRRRTSKNLSSKLHILYVEDNLANYSVAKLHLGSRHRLLIARNSREACMCLRAQHERLMVILMDIELRGSELDGIELTRLVRGRLEVEKMPDYAHGVPQLDIPIIFATAFNGRYSPGELEEAGGNLCVSKPIDFAKLERVLYELTGQKTPE